MKLPFLISLILLFISLSELFINEETKKYVQNKFEQFTLWFSYKKPSFLLEEYITENKVKNIILYLIGFYLITNTIEVIIDNIHQIGFSKSGRKVLKFIILHPLFYLLSFSIIYFTIFRRILNWISKYKSILYLYLKLTIVLISTIIVQIIASSNSGIDFPSISVGMPIYDYFKNVFNLILLFWSTSIILAVLFSYVVGFITLILDKFIFKFLKYLFWKISEYNNGVISAILLIVNFMLGLYLLLNE